MKPRRWVKLIILFCTRLEHASALCGHVPPVPKHALLVGSSRLASCLPSPEPSSTPPVGSIQHPAVPAMPAVLRRLPKDRSGDGPCLCGFGIPTRTPTRPRREAEKQELDACSLPISPRVVAAPPPSLTPPFHALTREQAVKGKTPDNLSVSPTTLACLPPLLPGTRDYLPAALCAVPSCCWAPASQHLVCDRQPRPLKA